MPVEDLLMTAAEARAQTVIRGEAEILIKVLSEGIKAAIVQEEHQFSWFYPDCLHLGDDLGDELQDARLRYLEHVVACKGYSYRLTPTAFVVTW